MKKQPVFIVFFALGALLLGVLACGAPTPTATPTPTLPPAPTADPGGLWLRLAGESKADQSWAVETDAEGNLYWGTFQQEPGELFTDWVIYKFDPNGNLVWEQRYGGEFQEKLFILAVSPPYLLAGGEQDDSMNIAQADMLVLALNLEDGSVAWEFRYDQGFGYEEVDGLVADGEDIYISGWTTSEAGGNDVGLVKLDRQGNLLWAQSWGSAGWDQGDGQMVVDEEYIYVSGLYNGATMLIGGNGLVAKFRKDSGEYVAHVTGEARQFLDGYGMTSDGTYLYVTGIAIVAQPGQGANGQVVVQKWDKELNLVWERHWGGNGGDQARAIGVDAAGRIVVAANATVEGNKQIALLVYDGEGNLLIESLWGGAGDDIAHGLWIDGEYAYLAGQTSSLGAGMQDALLLRVHISSGTFPPLP